MELSKCGKEGCNPVEQTRGQMKPEDHHTQHKRFVSVKAFSDNIEEHGVYMDTEAFRRDAYEVEDLGVENAHDFRVSCSKCGKATGWDRRDTEEFKNFGLGDNRRVMVTRDGNMDAVRARWNEMVK